MTVREMTPFRSRARLAEESAALHSSIADHLGDIVSIHDPDGTFRYVSAAIKDVLGYDPQEVLGTRLSHYAHPDDRPKLEIVNRDVLRGTPSTIAHRVRHKDSEYIWVEASLRPVRNEDTGVIKEVVCSTRPIGGAARVERLSSETYRETLERVQDVIENERINLVYQPVFDLETEQVIAYEALSRFPGNGARGPDTWFAEAWDVGLGVPMELLAVRVAASALRHLPEDVMLCINASPPTIFSDDFLEQIGGEADRIEVELTEHLHIEDYERFTSRLAPLRRAGIEIAIDDFGAGYASLRHILKVKPDWIKLDISLTEKVGENPVAHALATSLISFADEVGVRVVAEGIETEDELDALLEIGFRYGQGFYFGIPAPLEEALAAVS